MKTSKYEAFVKPSSFAQSTSKNISFNKYKNRIQIFLHFPKVKSGYGLWPDLKCIIDKTMSVVMVIASKNQMGTKTKCQSQVALLSNRKTHKIKKTVVKIQNDKER